MLPWIWASFMIHDDPSSARVVHPYLIGDELVGDGIPTRFVNDIAAEDVMTAAAMAPAAFRRIHDLVLPERQAAADQEQQRNREALARHPEARVNRHHEQFLSTWWQLSWRRPTMIAALFRLPRDIALSAHASRAPPARVSFATWLEDDGIPARVIDELMGHEPSSRGAQHLGSAMGAHYRHTTPEMAARVVAAIQARLTVVVTTAEETVEAHPTRVPRHVF